MIKLKRIMEDQTIKYRSKDGESKEMSADAAKRQPEDHPAKQAWLKTQSSGDSPEKSTEPKGADLFKTKEPASGDEDDRDEDKEEMAVDMNLNDSMAMDYEEDIEEVLSDSLGGEAVEVAFDGFDRRGNPIYVIEFEEGGMDKEITVNQKTGAIYDYDVDGVQGFDKDGTVYGTIGESKIYLSNLMNENKKKKGPSGADPKKSPEYFKGLSKKDKEERSNVIKRRTKMDDDDPDAYKPFRSDAGVKTKPSVHTKKFKKMFGENAWKTVREVYKMSKGMNEMSAAVKKSLKTKAEKTGMPFGILKQVFNRGMAAWKTGHRPGASQHQWAHARVNSFTTKSKGTWGKADKDLAKKVRGKNK
jgi:hypothetical protein